MIQNNQTRNNLMTPFNNAIALNNATYIDFFNRLQLLATTLYEWEGMPPLINLRFLEKTLFQFGRAVFHRDPKYGFMVSKVNPSGQFNYYDEPIRYMAWGIGYQRQMTPEEGVLIRNNPIMEPTQSTMQLFAHRLYEVERSLDVNIKGQKFPVLVKLNQANELSMKNIYSKYDGNHPVIYVDKSVDLNAMEVLNTGSPFVADKLMVYKHDIWNEAMSFLGIANANTDKKERLITSEVSANDQLIQLAAESMLATRREAADAINTMFGLNVSVKVKEYEGAAIPDQPNDSEAGAEGGQTE